MRVNDIARFHEFRQAAYTTGEHRRDEGKGKTRNIIAHVHGINGWNIFNTIMEGIDVIYWINLDRATERRAHMNKVLSDTRLDAIPKNRFSAFDSKKIELDDYFTMKKDILSVNYKVTKNEYACLLSHLETIRAFADSNYSTALILEDDVVFHKKDTIQHVLENAPTDWEIIRLSSNRFLNGPIKKYRTFTIKCNSTGCLADWGSQALFDN